MDNLAFGIPKQPLTTLRILNLDPDNLKRMLTQNEQGVLLKLVWRTQHTATQSLGLLLQTSWIVVAVHDGAKLHFAEKQMKLTENEENEKSVLAAQTTARRKGNPNMEKES